MVYPAERIATDWPESRRLLETFIDRMTITLDVLITFARQFFAPLEQFGSLKSAPPPILGFSLDWILGLDARPPKEI